MTTTRHVICPTLANVSETELIMVKVEKLLASVDRSGELEVIRYAARIISRQSIIMRKQGQRE